MALMSNFYHIQPAFTTGEISRDVANRVDLEKYKSALLRAENAIIRPYGAVCRRGGSEYIGETKYPDKPAILVRFARDAESAVLLEFGDKYVRVWEDGKYTGVDVTTPFEAQLLPHLRFAQSADTLFICSGKYPVQTLMRYGARDWRLKPYLFTHAYFEEMTQDELAEGRTYTTPGTYTYTAPEAKTYAIKVEGAGGAGYGTHKGGNGDTDWKSVYLSAGERVTVTVGKGGARQGEAGGASSFGSYVSAAGGGAATENADGKSAGDGYGGEGGVEKTGWYEGEEEDGGGWHYAFMQPAGNGSVRISDGSVVKVRPTGLRGEISLSATHDIFSREMIGSHIKIRHQMDSESVTLTLNDGADYSPSVRVGEQWKIVTSGIWTGTVTIEYSADNQEWREYRRYSSDKNFNATESGTFAEPTYLRIHKDASGESLTVTLTRLPYTHEGEARITAVTSGDWARAEVLVPFGQRTESSRFSLDVWNENKGYPRVCSFFQDRLVLAGTRMYPHMIWMSRTGDYPNFGVEKANGQVTDDSAVALSLISREMYNIRHLVPAQDLIVLTDGNEWIVPGDKAVTPKSAQVKTQTMRGASNCAPVYIGNRLIYVQARGGTVRDLGYTYESDNYNGTDLTLLAKHLVQGHELVAAAYAQEPDSVLYLVRDDGVMLCLTIIREQDVYGWSHWTTEGEYLWVENVPEGGEDSVYVIVRRGGKQYIERFRPQKETDYAYVDSYVKARGGKLAWRHLKGQTVQVVAGDAYTTETAAEQARAGQGVCGLAYEMRLEQPALELQMKDGTLQARTVKINQVTLRMLHSYGGKIGYTFDVMDALPYRERAAFSGDILATMPNTDVGFNTRGRVCISSREPYPFNLLAMIRSFTVGGGHVTTHNG